MEETCGKRIAGKRLLLFPRSLCVFNNVIPSSPSDASELFFIFYFKDILCGKKKKTTHSLRCFCKRCLPPEPSKTPPPICCRFDFFSPLLPLFPSRAFCLPDGRLRDEGRQEINGCDGVIKRKIAGHHQSTSDAVMIIAPLITGNWKSSCQMRWWLPLAERERERQGWLFPSSACFASSELTKTNQGDGY